MNNEHNISGDATGQTVWVSIQGGRSFYTPEDAREMAHEINMAAETARPLSSEPLSRAEIRRQTQTKDGLVEGTVVISLNEMVNLNYEGLLDLLTTQLVGDNALSELGFKITGYSQDKVQLLVNGYYHGIDDDETEDLV